jgi:hypothetical protein
MSVNKTSIQRIPDDILSSNDAILAISLIDMEGNILAAKSTDSFKDRFGVVILVYILLGHPNSLIGLSCKILLALIIISIFFSKLILDIDTAPLLSNRLEIVGYS